MPHAAERDRAGRRTPEPAGATHAGSGVWVKRWSLSVPDAGARGTGTVGRDLRSVEPPEPDREHEVGGPHPSGAAPTGPPTGPLPRSGVEQELRALHAAMAELRREVRELRTGREEAD